MKSQTLDDNDEYLVLVITIIVVVLGYTRCERKRAMEADKIAGDSDQLTVDQNDCKITDRHNISNEKRNFLLFNIITQIINSNAEYL